MHIRAAFEEGACGAVAFAWTDEWWRGGHTVDDWAFGLVDAARQPKPALAAVSGRSPRRRSRRRAAAVAEGVGGGLRLQRRRHHRRVPDLARRRSTYPERRDHRRQRRVDVTRRARSRARYPKGAGHRHPERRPERGAQRRPRACDRRDRRLHRRRRARRSRLADLSGAADPRRAVVGSGGPNVVPPDDDWVAQCVARAPGGPTHVLLDDRVAEHVPGCNMAFRREALRRSAASTPSTCAPATTWTSAGGCRRADCGSASRPRHSSGITIAPRCQGLLAAAGRLRRRRDLARRAPSREVRRAARCCGAATSTARCRSCGR